jgi:hypothetical protein
MLTIHCPLRDKNAKVLREMYDKRDQLIARGGSAVELKAAEYDLIRMHRIVKRHRARCPRCRLNDGFMTGFAMRPKPLFGEAPFLPIRVR